MREFSDVARGNVGDEELTRAKSVIPSLLYCTVLIMYGVCVCVCVCRNQLKSSYLMSTESQSGLVEDIAAQVNTVIFMV